MNSHDPSCWHLIFAVKGYITHQLKLIYGVSNVTLGKRSSKRNLQYYGYTPLGTSSGATHDLNRQTFEQSHQFPVTASPQ